MKTPIFELVSHSILRRTAPYRTEDREANSLASSPLALVRMQERGNRNASQSALVPQCWIIMSGRLVQFYSSH